MIPGVGGNVNMKASGLYDILKWCFTFQIDFFLSCLENFSKFSVAQYFMSLLRNKAAKFSKCYKFTSATCL